MPSARDEALCARLAAATQFHRLVHVAQCPSTQDLAAADPGADPAIFWADHQTAGRGRQQRPWHDAPGADLLATFRVRPRLPVPMALPVAVPLCVVEAVEPLLAGTGRALRLKWPNDVLVDGRKLAGVLIDADSGHAGRFLIGLGINVNGTALPAELQAVATSLRLLTGRMHDRAELLLALATGLDRALRALADGELAPFEQRFRASLGLMGRRVVVRAGDVVRGRLEALGFDGLRLDDGRTFPLGQVQELRAE
jgi:BirA family biotin operon repressor/biotin-[acetyl-CoA-carboxylase] ligase